MSDDLENLEERIKKVRDAEAAEAREESEEREENENMNKGMQAGMELVTSIAAGAFLGWLLDKWLGTHPWGLIVFLVAGIFTGFLGVYKITQDMGTGVGFAPLHKREKDAKKTPENTE